MSQKPSYAFSAIWSVIFLVAGIFTEASDGYFFGWWGATTAMFSQDWLTRRYWKVSASEYAMQRRALREKRRLAKAEFKKSTS